MKKKTGEAGYSGSNHRASLFLTKLSPNLHKEYSIELLTESEVTEIGIDVLEGERVRSAFPA